MQVSSTQRQYRVHFTAVLQGCALNTTVPRLVLQWLGGQRHAQGRGIYDGGMRGLHAYRPVAAGFQCQYRGPLRMDSNVGNEHGPRERIGIQHQLMDESAHEARALKRRTSKETMCAEFGGSAWSVSDTQIFIAISFRRIGFIFYAAEFAALRNRASRCVPRFDCGGHK
jgi:hypothetical protein